MASKEDPNDPAGRQGWTVWVQVGTGNYRLGFERFRDGTNQGLYADGVIKLNEYSHIAATFDGSAMKLYVNGKLVGTATYQTPNSLKDHSLELRLGERSSTCGCNFQGRIDEAAVYDYALPQPVVGRRYYEAKRSYQGLVMSDGPLAYWRLGESSGTTANDESPNNKDGTYVSSPTLGAGGAIVGDTSTAISLNGTSQYVSGGDNFDFAGTAPFSFEAWAHPTTIDNIYRRFAAKEDQADPAGRQGWLFWVHDAGSGNYMIGFERYQDGVAQGVYVNNSIKVNEYSHVVASFDGKTMKVYINGALSGSTTPQTPVSMKDHAGQFRVGASSASLGYFAGRLDEAAVYDYALTDKAIADRYAQKRTNSHDSIVLADGPLSYWRLAEVSGTVANDESPNDKDGTYVNSPSLGGSGGIAGDTSTAVSLNGTSQYVSGGDNFDFAGTAPFSFEVWAHPTTIDNIYRRFAAKEDQADPAGRQGWLFWVHDEGSGNYMVGFDRYRDGVVQFVHVNNAIRLNEYSHVVATFDGKTMKVYVNGVLAGTTTPQTPVSMKDHAGQFRVGASSASLGYFAGRLDEAAVYDYALSAEAVKLHHGDTQLYGYDNLHRLTSATYPGPTTDAYTYDAVGNRLTKNSTNYTNDAADRLTAVGGTSYGYDNNGNLTSRGSDSFAWDVEDRLTSTTVGGTTTTFAYNGDGLRNSRTTGGNTTTFTWDVASSIPQVLDDGTFRYVYGIGRIAEVGPGTTTHYYLPDGLGSTMALADANGAAVNTYEYDVFGALRYSTAVRRTSSSSPASRSMLIQGSST